MDFPAPGFSLLNTSISQGLSQLDPLSSLPSEPPEIGKWFSSYGYESPKLNIGEELECQKSVRGNYCVNEGCDSKEANKLKEILDELKKVEKKEKFVGDENVYSEGLVRCKNVNNNFASQVLDSTDSLLLTSEPPPDIKNWFSSYAYESPALASGDDIGFSDSEENITDTEQCVAEKISLSKEASRETNEIGKNHDFVGEKLAPTGADKSKRSLETNDYEYAHKGNNGIDRDLASSAPTDLPFKRTSELILEGNNAKDHEVHDNDPFKDAKISSFNVKDSTKKLQKDMSAVGSHLSLPSSRSSFHNEGKAQTEDELNVLTHRESDIIAGDDDFLKKTGKSSNKENEGNYFRANGFVSTRKGTSRRENDENSLTNSVGHQSGWLKNAARVSKDGSKNVTIQRKVLSETTNIQCSDALEITGKWRCPQKREPNLGPPLKQLRLEQWVRRV